MENASKALLIAGGILLAVLVLSLLGLLLSNISSNQLAQEKRLEAEQLQEFNQKYESYNKKALFGVDIITLQNLAKTDGNIVQIEIKNENETEIEIEIEKTTVYTCTGMKYDNGKISKLSFEKRSQK